MKEKTKMKSEKATISAKDYGSNKYLGNESTMAKVSKNQNNFQYGCDFCQRELPSGGHRFAGFGACRAATGWLTYLLTLCVNIGRTTSMIWGVKR
jgi:hypothetical protein